MQALPSPHSETYTLTFGDQAENHAGMQKIGDARETGLTGEELKDGQAWFEARGCKVEMIPLHEAVANEEGVSGVSPAYVLIARKGLSALLGEKGTTEAFFEEQKALQKDSKAFMYGRVVNKKARHNLCFGEQAQEADYEKGRGTVVAFSSVPLLSHVRSMLPRVFGKKTRGLVAEGNYYYDPKKCGIGWHGDGERRIVVAVRLGASMPLHFHWFYRHKPVGKTMELMLNHGDVYAMSEVSVGTEWKKSSVYTLRHAAGAAKYLALP